MTAGNGLAADGWRSRFYPGSLKFGASPTEYGHQYYAYLYDPQGNLVQRQAQNNQSADVLDTVLYDAYGNPSNDLDTTTGLAETYKDPVGFGGGSTGTTRTRRRAHLCLFSPVLRSRDGQVHQPGPDWVCGRGELVRVLRGESGQ